MEGAGIVPSISPLLLSHARRSPRRIRLTLPIEDEFLNMAIIKSQKKRNRQNEIRRVRNKSVLSDLKSSIRRLEDAAGAGEPTDELFRVAQSKIDTAVSKGVLNKGTAARKKSRLAGKLSG